MASDFHKLPTSKPDLVRIIDDHVASAEISMAHHIARWTINDLYLNMVRDFSIVDIDHGTVLSQGIFDIDRSTGELRYTHQQMLAQFDRIRSRFANLDVSPLVTAKSSTLQTMRQRGVAQVLAEAVRHPPHIKRINDQLSLYFCLYGSAGLSARLENHKTIGLGADFEVIPPWELMPYPLIGRDTTKQFGLLRRRFVSEDFLKDNFGARAFSANKDKLRPIRIRFGQPTSQQSQIYPDTSPGGITFAGGSTSNSPHLGSKLKGSSKFNEGVFVYEIVETWLNGPFDTLSRYIVKVSDWIPIDEDLTSATRFCPIGYGRFVDAGRFWGYGVPDLLMSSNRWAERLLQQVFKNVEETDKFGILVLPHDMVDQNIALRDVGHGLRVMRYSPDPYGQNTRPTVINPATTGDFPGRVAQLALSLQNSIIPESPLARGEAPGRVDNFQSLSLIDEQTRGALSNAQSQYASIWGTVDRSLVSDTARAFESGAIIRNNKSISISIPISRVDESIIGVVINPNGEVDLSENPLPNPAALEFSIRDKNPRSIIARKQEAIELLKLGIQTPEQLKLLGIEEGLDFAIFDKGDENAARKTKLNIVLLFGDGVTSNTIIINPDAETPEISLRILSNFMNSPEFALADPDVQNEFLSYRRFLQSRLSAVLPEGLPSIDSIVSSVSNASQSPSNPTAALSQLQSASL